MHVQNIIIKSSVSGSNIIVNKLKKP